MAESNAPRVVVTGLGVVAPNAHGVPGFVDALRAARSGIRFQQHLADANFACQVGGISVDIQLFAERYLSSADLFAMNANMMYAASRQAFIDATAAYIMFAFIASRSVDGRYRSARSWISAGMPPT